MVESINLTNIGVGVTITILVLREVLPYIANRVNGHSSNPHGSMIVNGADLIAVRTIVTEMKGDVSGIAIDVKRINGSVTGLATWKNEHEARHTRDDRQREKV